MSCNTCNDCTNTTSVAGCKYTINTDCVVYNQEVLDFESTDTVANSTRTLTDLLQQIENCCNRPSVIETEDFSITEDHIGKLILLKAEFDDVSGGTMSLEIELPDDIAYAGVTLAFKDISGTGTGGRIAEWAFDEDVQYAWSPATLSTDDYTTLAELSNENKVLYLTFVKVTSTSYQWLIV